MACDWILNERRDDGCMAYALLPLVSGQTSNLSQHPFLLSLDAALGYFSIAALAETSRSELDHEVISFHHPFSSVSSLSHVQLQHARPPCPSPTPRVYSTHVHGVGDAIQSFHPLSSPSPPAFSLSFQ